MESVDAVVIGAGVVGLATARALAQAGREVLILEQEDAFGTGTSARNSEVIHAGIYYPPGSLKARLCVEGRKALYAFCESHGVPHRRCGKLIVATAPAELPAFDAIAARAQANGVDDLKVLTAAEAKAMEPALACVGALHSPSTGIIDSHGFMLALLGDAEAAGAMMALEARVESLAAAGDGIVVRTGGAAAMDLLARTVVVAAGHGAIPLGRTMAGLPPATVPPAWRAKGSYFRLQGRAPFSRLIYPAPVDGGLGVHLTLDMGGQARFGPDVEWRQDEDYAVDPRRGDSFYAAVRRYWPDLADGALLPDYAGIRPKVTGPGEPAGDFILSGPADHGVAGLVLHYGIESPGLTSALAIADMTVAALGPG